MTHIATGGVSSDSVLASDISCSIPFFQSIRSMQGNLLQLLCGANVVAGVVRYGELTGFSLRLN